MIKYATIFITMAIISAVLGYGEIVGAMSIIAKAAFFLFIILYVISILSADIEISKSKR